MVYKHFSHALQHVRHVCSYILDLVLLSLNILLTFVCDLQLFQLRLHVNTHFIISADIPVDGRHAHAGWCCRYCAPSVIFVIIPRAERLTACVFYSSTWSGGPNVPFETPCLFVMENSQELLVHGKEVVLGHIEYEPRFPVASDL